jgi:hypothetical protein
MTNGLLPKRVPGPCLTKRRAQAVDVVDQKPLFAIGEVHREEEGAPGTKLRR